MNNLSKKQRKELIDNLYYLLKNHPEDWGLDYTFIPGTGELNYLPYRAFRLLFMPVENDCRGNFRSSKGIDLWMVPSRKSFSWYKTMEFTFWGKIWLYPLAKKIFDNLLSKEKEKEKNEIDIKFKKFINNLK